MLKPLGDRVLLKRSDPAEKTKGGIIIPPSAQEKVTEGTVLAVGPGTRNDRGERVALDVEAGQTVIFGRYAGTDIKVDGEECLVVRIDDVLAVMG